MPKKIISIGLFKLYRWKAIADMKNMTATIPKNRSFASILVLSFFNVLNTIPQFTKHKTAPQGARFQIQVLFLFVPGEGVAYNSRRLPATRSQAAPRRPPRQSFVGHGCGLRILHASQAVGSLCLGESEPPTLRSSPSF